MQSKSPQADQARPPKPLAERADAVSCQYFSRPSSVPKSGSVAEWADGGSRPLAVQPRQHTGNRDPGSGVVIGTAAAGATVSAFRRVNGRAAPARQRQTSPRRKQQKNTTRSSSDGWSKIYIQTVDPAERMRQAGGTSSLLLSLSLSPGRECTVCKRRIVKLSRADVNELKWPLALTLHFLAHWRGPIHLHQTSLGSASALPSVICCCALSKRWRRR